MHITIHPGQEVDRKIRDFLEKKGIKKIIAFSGGADIDLGLEEANEKLKSEYEEMLRCRQELIIGAVIAKLQIYKVAILTGGTEWGVPSTAMKAAKENNLTTIGVYPKGGEKYSLGEEYLDLSICVSPTVGESQWGDESQIFAKLLDGVIVYGGKAGTLVEMAHVLKMNEFMMKYNEPIKYIVPIAGTSGVAEGLPFVWAKAGVKQACMPNREINTGEEAVEFLRQSLFLDNYINLEA